MKTGRKFQQKWLGVLLSVILVLESGCTRGFILRVAQKPTDSTTDATKDFVYNPDQFLVGIVSFERAHIGRASDFRLKTYRGSYQANLAVDASGNRFIHCGDGFQGGQRGALSTSPDGRFVVVLTDCGDIMGETSPWGAAQAVFWDRKTGVKELISQNSLHQPGNQASYSVSVSNDGRYVVFATASDNLLPNENGFQSDVFLKDRQLGTLTRISDGMGGVSGDGDSSEPVISGSGKFIVYGSSSTNLVAGDTNGENDIFLYDIDAQTTTLISKPSGGGQSNSYSATPSISADGNKVVFFSDADNLVASDTNGKGDIFLYERNSGSITRVSTSSAGVQADETSREPFISQDGNRVSMRSVASNLVSNDTNGEYDIFVKDLNTMVMKRVSVMSTGAEIVGGGGAYNAILSPNGRFVVFSTNDRLAPTDTNNESNIYVYDLQNNTLEQLDVNLVYPHTSPDAYLYMEI